MVEVPGFMKCIFFSNSEGNEVKIRIHQKILGHNPKNNSKILLLSISKYLKSLRGSPFWLMILMKDINIPTTHRIIQFSNHYHNKIPKPEWRGMCKDFPYNKPF